MLKITDYPIDYLVFCEGCTHGCPSPLAMVNSYGEAEEIACNHVRSKRHSAAHPPAEALIRAIEETNVREAQHAETD